MTTKFMCIVAVVFSLFSCVGDSVVEVYQRHIQSEVNK